MRKMKRLFKLRNKLIPWFNWGKIHFILNTICLIAFIFTLCFTGVTQAMSIWFMVCMAQYIPIFIIMAGDYIFETVLYKNILAIIKVKMNESKIAFNKVVFTVDDFTLHSCTIITISGIDTSKQIQELMNIVHKMNRRFGNGYDITLILPNETKN